MQLVFALNYSILMVFLCFKREMHNFELPCIITLLQDPPQTINHKMKFFLYRKIGIIRKYIAKYDLNDSIMQISKYDMQDQVYRL